LSWWCPFEEQTLEEEAEAIEDNNEGDAQPLPHLWLLPEGNPEQLTRVNDKEKQLAAEEQDTPASSPSP
jgi:hypothetical protein